VRISAESPTNYRSPSRAVQGIGKIKSYFSVTFRAPILIKLFNFNNFPANLHKGWSSSCMQPQELNDGPAAHVEKFPLDPYSGILTY
jgi:hypothetical protein